MGFNQSIVENALLSCGRHCCLCHEFCGTKIELHHIEQRKNEMDLFINIGRNIAGYSNLASISENAFLELQPGHLRYLSNRASNSLATIYSTLIPINYEKKKNSNINIFYLILYFL